MSLPALDNLVRIGQLKAEPRNEAEAMRMLAMARTRLEDARLANLSIEGRFTSPLVKLSLKHLPCLFKVHPFCRRAAIPAEVQPVIHPEVSRPAV